MNVNDWVKVTDPNCKEYGRIGKIIQVGESHPMLGACLYIETLEKEVYAMYACELTKM